jgi:hypothetical protein
VDLRNPPRRVKKGVRYERLAPGSRLGLDNGHQLTFDLHANKKQKLVSLRPSREEDVASLENAISEAIRFGYKSLVIIHGFRHGDTWLKYLKAKFKRKLTPYEERKGASILALV